MSANEIGNLSPKLKNQANLEQTTQNIKNDETLNVFASDQVSGIVDLNATPENSLFANNVLRATSKNGTLDTATKTNADEVISELPEDICKKYPSEKDQTALKTLTNAQLEQARKLMDSAFPAQNIVQIVKMFKPEQIDTIKKQALEMEDLSEGKDKVYMMVLGNDKYDLSAFTLSSLDFNLTMRTNVLNKDLSVRSIEKLTESMTEDNVCFREREAFDLETNTLSRTRYELSDNKKAFVPTYEIRSKIKDNGSMISREYIKPSKIGGLYNVEVLTEDGTKNTSKVDQKKNGKTTVKRNMESPDGTKTEYLYRDTPDGNRYMRYKITDKEGNVLMNNKKSFKVVNENTFKSSFNDESYTMTVKDNVLTVKDDKDETNTAQIDLSTIEGKKEALIPILKQMPGDQLIALSKTTDKLIGIDTVIESYYSAKTHSINSGDDMFVVLHEEGHAKDFQTLNLLDVVNSETSMISRDMELIETFEREKKSFNDAFPDAQREHIDYFINSLTHYGGVYGGLQETVAESNAILETPRSHKVLGLRTQYLQQYFPKTIARLNTLLTEDRERAEQKAPWKIPELNIPDLKIPKFPNSKTKE